MRKTLAALLIIAFLTATSTGRAQAYWCNPGRPFDNATTTIVAKRSILNGNFDVIRAKLDDPSIYVEGAQNKVWVEMRADGQSRSQFGYTVDSNGVRSVFGKTYDADGDLADGFTLGPYHNAFDDALDGDGTHERFTINRSDLWGTMEFLINGQLVGTTVGVSGPRQSVRIIAQTNNKGSQFWGSSLGPFEFHNMYWQLGNGNEGDRTSDFSFEDGEAIPVVDWYNDAVFGAVMRVHDTLCEL